jgi:hypothetical protein
MDNVLFFMEARGLSCTNRTPRNNETQLEFSDGSTVHVGRYLTYIDPDGKPSPDCITFRAFKSSLPPIPTQSSDSQQSPVAAQIEEILFNRGYGHCLTAKKEHGELNLEFAGDVQVWIMPGSIKLERPGRKTLRVKTPEKLEKALTVECAPDNPVPLRAP